MNVRHGEILYVDDWAKAHPHVPPILSMRGAEKQSWVHAVDLYVEKRWKDVDGDMNPTFFDGGVGRPAVRRCGFTSGASS